MLHLLPEATQSGDIAVQARLVEFAAIFGQQLVGGKGAAKARKSA
jgi:hypothetical protein